MITTTTEIQAPPACIVTLGEYMRGLVELGAPWTNDHVGRIEHHIAEIDKTWFAMMTMALAQPITEAKCESGL